MAAIDPPGVSIAFGTPDPFFSESPRADEIIEIGSRIVVPKDPLIQWIESKTNPSV